MTQSIIRTLASDIDRFVDYFRTKQIPPPSRLNFKEPMFAVRTAFGHPWQYSPGWGQIKIEKFHSGFAKFFRDNHVAELAHVAHGYRGWTAETFIAKIAVPRSGQTAKAVFRFGTEAGWMPHLLPPWNPLLLQPHALTVLTQNRDARLPKLVLTRMPLPPMVIPGGPAGFIGFMNRHVLRKTPYLVQADKDWCVLPDDDTPVSSDPADSLVFKNGAAARKHRHDAANPKHQQKIMGIIHRNTMRLNFKYERATGGHPLPDAMRWVEIDKKSGLFVMKQSWLLPDPLAAEPVRNHRQPQHRQSLQM